MLHITFTIFYVPASYSQKRNWIHHNYYYLLENSKQQIQLHEKHVYIFQLHS